MTLFLQIHWWIIVNDCPIKEQLSSSLWLRLTFKCNNPPLLNNTRALSDNKVPLLRNKRALLKKDEDCFCGSQSFLYLCN